MEYYVVYDLNDSIVSYCDNLEELSIFVNRRKKELKYRFKYKDIVYIQSPIVLKIYRFLDWFMNYRSKIFIYNNYFVLYDLNDNIICYYDSFVELYKIINYKLSDLVREYNRNHTNILTVIVENKKYKLATFEDNQ